MGDRRTWQREGRNKARDENSQVSVQRTRGSWMWLKVGETRSDRTLQDTVRSLMNLFLRAAGGCGRVFSRRVSGLIA